MIENGLRPFSIKLFMRYFAEISYCGTRYAGWQKQPGELPSVQGVVEDAMSLILAAPIEITGCGRTDTGVHARQYFLHFDFEGEFPEGFLKRLNKFLPADIAFRRIFPVASGAHARFDAYERSYEYHLTLSKDPFTTGLVYFFPFRDRLDFDKTQQAAGLLLQYDTFFPFCKSNTDDRSLRCDLKRAEWVSDPENDRLIFHISSNRFLRGMVRLIVGMCLNVGMDQVSLDEVKEAMEAQTRLAKSWSVPGEGLYLTGVRYRLAPVLILSPQTPKSH